MGGGDYVLPSRDLLVNEIELNVKAHHLDAMVLIGTCDKVVPAMLMAAGRVNIPTVIVTGGKDSLQLVSDHATVKLVTTRMGQTTTAT